jgi:hypothetical protein
MISHSRVRVAPPINGGKTKRRSKLEGASTECLYGDREREGHYEIDE